MADSARTAQAAMRHSTLDLTMNTYTDPRLLDVVGAMDALPSLPLGDRPNSNWARASGTSPSFLVPMPVPASGNARADAANAGKTDGVGGSLHIAASVANDSGSDSLTRHDKKRVKGLEPSTFSLEVWS